MRVIKGCPRDKWEEVQAVQHEPFIFIQSNGSKWYGQDPDDVTDLLRVLEEYELEDWAYIMPDPCRGVDNPAWQYGSIKPRYIDGPRLYEADGVYRFAGNFKALSHVFTIDTNDAVTIAALKTAIEANRARRWEVTA